MPQNNASFTSPIYSSSIPLAFRPPPHSLYSSFSGDTYPFAGASSRRNTLNMKNVQKKLLKACVNKWRKMGSEVIPCAGCEHCCQWGLWSSSEEAKSIPKDVPKGHLVVYVGENCRRFVIKVRLLKHPLFRALLDQAQDEYDFTADSKLCIPCDESIFLDVVRCASSPEQGRSCLRV